MTILTLAEAAKYLKVTEPVLIAEAEAGRVPGKKVGGEWRFLVQALAAWFHDRGKQLTTFQDWLRNHPREWNAEAEREAEEEIARLREIRKSYGTIGDGEDDTE